MAWVCVCKCVNGQVEQCRECSSNRDAGVEVFGVFDGKPITVNAPDSLKKVYENHPEFYPSRPV